MSGPSPRATVLDLSRLIPLRFAPHRSSRLGWRDGREAGRVLQEVPIDAVMVGLLVAHPFDGNVVKTAEPRVGAGEQDGRMRGKG